MTCPVCRDRKVVPEAVDGPDFAPRVELKPCPECTEIHVLPWWAPLLLGIAVVVGIFFLGGAR